MRGLKMLIGPMVWHVYKKKVNCKEHFEINHYYLEKAKNENFMMDWPLNRLVFTQNFKIIGH